MLIPEPEAGLVIRYNFLWSHETAPGAAEASKDRPCAIILVVQDADGSRSRVSVLPITHAAPSSSGAALTHLKLTPGECRAAGLGAGEHWVVLAELNRFVWPGYDLRPAPGGESCVHGRLPVVSWRRIVSAFLTLDDALKAAGQARQTMDRDT